MSRIVSTISARRRSQGRRSTTADRAGGVTSLCWTADASNAWALSSETAHEAPSTTDRGIRVRRGERAGWMSSGVNVRLRCTTTPWRMRFLLPWGRTMCTGDGVRERNPSAMAAETPPRTACGPCANTSLWMISLGDSGPEWRTTTPRAGLCQRPLATIQRSRPAPKRRQASATVRTVSVEGTDAGWPTRAGPATRTPPHGDKRQVMSLWMGEITCLEDRAVALATVLSSTSRSGARPGSRMRPRPEGSPTEPAGAAARCTGASQSPHNGVPGPATPPLGAARQARRAR
jgi:hypothetical protein